MSLLASLAVPLLLASLASAEQAQAVFRDPVLEITLPPGVPLPTATRTGDASGADFSSETPSGIYRIHYYNPPAGFAGHSIASLLGFDPKNKISEDLARMKAHLEASSAGDRASSAQSSRM
jgi:hypothetical protein